MLFIAIQVYIEYLIFIFLRRIFAFLIKESFELIIKFLISFSKLKRYMFNYNQVVNEKNSYFLFIELINVFKLIFLLFHYLKLKKKYIIMLLKNL